MSETQAPLNRLSGEPSPYLSQHAQNPVDWYPWGEEAFERARAEDKPVFLSVGYSTCHWCHVMAHESFEDERVADLMNRVFVSIKVDREERPDIDGQYMAVCQMLTGAGGWPLTIIMTPDKKPFFAATYLPRESRFGRVGLVELIPRIEQVWRTRREEAVGSADRVAAAFRDSGRPRPGREPDRSTLDLAHDQLAQRFDRLGGFSSAPKFPTPHNILFLLRYWRRSGNTQALDMAVKTLEAMRLGGIFDHLGFGFHRYSTDQRWLVPHFEKMLYDQALLALAYLEAHQATGRADFARTAREVFDYVRRDLTGPEGGFYSAQDADSEGQEGKYYLWTAGELREVLGPEEAELMAGLYNVREEGNFAEEASGRRSGANILHLSLPLEAAAARLGLGTEELAGRVEAARLKLLAVRSGRVPPQTDDKILTDWNGLMIAALARGAQVLAEPALAEAAERAAGFLLQRLRDPRGRLLHRFRAGRADVGAFVDDYAFLTWGLIELYEAAFNPDHLEAALALNDELAEHFWDRTGDGFFFSADDGEELLIRDKAVYDGAVPSGNSVALLNLLRLARLTGRGELEERAGRLARALAGVVAEAPSAFTQFMCGLDFALGPAREVVIVGRPEDADTRAMLAALGRTFAPNKAVLLKPPDPESPQALALARLAPFTAPMTGLKGRATAYVCRDQACQAPTNELSQMLESLGGE